MILFKEQASYDEYYFFEDYSLIYRHVKKIDKRNKIEQNYSVASKTIKTLKINELKDDGFKEIKEALDI